MQMMIQQQPPQGGAVDRPWEVAVFCGPDEMGDPIPCVGWNVLSTLSAVRAVLPPGWSAEAFPALARRMA